MFCPSCGTEVATGQQFCKRCGQALNGAQANTPSAPAAADTHIYAGFWRRAAAILIDMILVWIVITVLMRAGGRGAADAAPALALVKPLAVIVGLLLYWSLFESSSLQATPGKRVLAIKVTDLGGARIGIGRALGRNVARPLSALPFYAGYIAAGFTRRRQTFHDMIAETLVVKRVVTPEEVVAAASATIEGAGLGVIVIAVVAGFGFIVITGILAAIAIPAYQDYTIRAQIYEGITLAQPFQAAVADAIAQGAEPGSIDGPSLHLSPVSAGKYVEAVKVGSGVVAIRYGQAANPLIRGKTLLLLPAINSQRQVAWVCGHAVAPAGYDLGISDTGHFTTVADKYLPTNCREHQPPSQ